GLTKRDAAASAGRGKAGRGRGSEWAAAAAAADGLDVLAGSFCGVRETLLGLDPHDAARAWIAPDGNPTSKASALAAPVLLAGGVATVSRLRVVDAFGRWREVRTEDARVASTLEHPDGAPN